jgi:hypothetical protein
MPEHSACEVRFPAGEARADVFVGAGVLVYGGMLLLLAKDCSEAAWVMLGCAAYLFWRGVRSWGKPYVVLGPERLVIFDRGRPKHYVPLDAITAVQRSFNRTRLVMQDGLVISVSHLGFVSKTDVDCFRAELSRRVSCGMA